VFIIFSSSFGTKEKVKEIFLCVVLRNKGLVSYKSYKISAELDHYYCSEIFKEFLT
jgi:hypothetical protein